MFKKLAKLLGIKSYIKIPNRSFDQLNNGECAMMIDAFLNDGNDFFEQNALPEFTLMNYKSKQLQLLKGSIENIQKQYRTDSKPDGLMSESGQKELRVLEAELKKRSTAR